jgi:small-conductance mechanosensitive channel
MLKHSYILLFILLFTVQTVSSQDNQQKTGDEEKVTEPKLRLIPSNEFTIQIPDATKKIKKIEKSLISRENLYAEKAKLDTFMLNLKKFEQKHKTFEKVLADQSRLQDELYQWDKKKEKLNSIQKTFDNINNELLKKKDKLSEIKTLWEKSLEAAQKDNLPQNARKLVTSLLNEINQIELLVNQKSNFVYSQLEKITKTTIEVNDKIQKIEGKLNNLTDLLLFSKEPPIISLIFSKNDTIKTQRTYSVRELYTPIRNYIIDNDIYLILHFLFFVTVLILMTIVKRRINPEKYRTINPRLLQTVFEVLSRPVSTSFMIYLLTSHLIYSDAPPIMNTLIYFMLLIPVMIILPLITVKQLNFYIYGLGFIYLLTLFLRLHLIVPALQYIIILAAIIMSIWGIGKFLKRTIIIRIFHDSFSRTLISLLFYAFIALLVISFVSLLIGYYTLGVFLFDNTIWSIYRFFLFYAAYVLLEGFTELLLNSEITMKIKSVKPNKEAILSWLNSVIRLFLTFFLFKDVFTLFKIWDDVTEFVSNIWNYKFTPGELSFSIGNIFTLIITLYISNLLSKVISTLLEKDVLQKFRFKRGVPRTISTLAKYTILTIGFLIAVAAAGMDIQNFTIILGALGVGIGFGLQDIINNFISGLILLFERPIQVEDKVQIGQLWGIVKNIGIRSSVIRAFDGSEVIVPNSMLISREVTNWTLSDQKRRLDIEVGVEYGADLEKVMKILIDSAKKNKNVMDDPAPTAWFVGFGDNSINFKLVFWHPEFDGSLSVKSEVAVNIFSAFEKEGITIPFPQQDVYIKSAPENTFDRNVNPDTSPGKEKNEDDEQKTGSTKTINKPEPQDENNTSVKAKQDVETALDKEAEQTAAETKNKSEPKKKSTAKPKVKPAAKKGSNKKQEES